IEDAGLALLVSEPRVAQGLPAHAARVVLVDDPAADAPAARPRPRARAEDIAYVIYTSGTTGRPKGVEIPHRAAVNFLASMQARPGLTAADRLLAVTSLSFDISGLELFLPLSVGAQIQIADRDTAMDGAALRRRLERDGITVMQATPSTWRLLLDAGWQGGPGFTVLVGGEAVPRELVDALAPRVGAVWNMYGPTETTIWSCIHPLAAGGGPVLIGRPIANTRVVVLDRHLAPVPAGVTGELYIGGAGLARGYLGRPELTRERFLDDPFVPGERLYRTGDLARWRPDGTLECLGRLDHQVKLRGYRIELGEIEAVLAEHAAVREAIVAVRDERLVAYLVARDPDAKPAAGDLRRHLRAKLPDIMIPAAFVALDAIPLLPNGKIDRARLPAPGGGHRAAPQVAPPRDELEAQLAAIFCSVLDVSAVGVTDSFFDLGGHSMLAVRVLAEIQRRFDKTLPLIALFRSQTVEQLAMLLRAEGVAMPTAATASAAPTASTAPAASTAPISATAPAASTFGLIPLQPAGAKPPLFLVSPPGTDPLAYRTLAQHLDPDRPVYGVHDETAAGALGRPATHEQLEVWATRHVETIRAVQPQGPYLLSGTGEGAWVAFAMTHLLETAGQRVTLLAILDTAAPLDAAPPEPSNRPMLQRVTGYMKSVRALASRGLRDPLELVRGRAKAPVASPIALFRASSPRTGPLRDQRLGWADRTTGGVEVHPVLGDQVTFLREPHVASTAHALDACIRRRIGR
ncbi:MAG TPA: amino acid adenylation domain-containing protein, partial [Kofleriaceae bacterium]|nr:amino acid adenylation domain-containing protein [Kofleriaceae bacterium]